MAKLSVAIQAGGMSSRMGQDKGLLPFGDGTLVEYILRQVENLGLDIYLITNQPENYRFLEIPVYSDIHKGIGALAGLHTILNYMESDYVLALACDMPFINIGLIKHMIGICEGVDIVIPSLGESGYFEPFRSIYSRSCLTHVEDAIRKGKRRVISFFDDLSVLKIEQEVIDQYDPSAMSFLNINTPEDYQRLLMMAENLAGDRLWQK
jgi:molybdopterin-guanine dinucleotide biosynthesis protein A